MIEDLNSGDFRALHGTVVDNADPLGLGRVKFMIPEYIDPESAWALPAGTLGGGGPQAGFFIVPPIGADVVVFFIMGDIQRPIYMPAHWGNVPNTGPETPSAIAELEDKTQAKDIAAFQFGPWQMVFDRRQGSRAFYIKEAESGDLLIEYDGEKKGLTLKGTLGVRIKADGIVTIEGAMVQINGRVVSAGVEPI